MVHVLLAAVALTGAPAASQSDDCGRDRIGDWQWVCRIAASAGYRIVGNTGSALVGAGQGASFYIWTTRATRRVETTKPVACVHRVPVYGDARLWRWWVAQERVVWLQAGPRRASRLPGRSGLARLVASSRRIPRLR